MGLNLYENFVADFIFAPPQLIKALLLLTKQLHNQAHV